MPLEALGGLVLGQAAHQAHDIARYVEWQAKESVRHLEKVKTEHLLGDAIDCWDVWTDRGRWWVLTQPTNLYSHELFPSLDCTISFHVGIRVRMMAHRKGPDVEAPRVHDDVIRRLKQAGETLDQAKEPEDFQAVGMRCRECLLALVRTLAIDVDIPEGRERPKAGDFIHWSELITDGTARGGNAKEVRAHLKALARSTWQLVSWLTHASNAVRHDAFMAHEATEYLVSAFHHAHAKHKSGAPERCPNCYSYRIAMLYRPELEMESPYISLCESCGWVDAHAHEVGSM
jgi:hypothetical protein